MDRTASISRRITYTHVPKDGRTPVYDSISKRWNYIEAPTPSQMEFSANRFADLESVSFSAQESSKLAFSKAEAAQETADSKVTAAEAVRSVKTSMFELVPLSPDGFSSLASMRTIRFKEVSKSAWEIFLVLDGSDDDHADSSTHQWLNYVTRNELDVNLIYIEERLAAIEKRLGIS